MTKPRHIDAVYRRVRSQQIRPMRQVVLAWPEKPHPLKRFLFGRFALPSLIVACGVVVAFSIQLSAFEAHVLDITAVIERGENSCDARGPRYWRDAEGCVDGQGESVWFDQVNILSQNFSGVFGNLSGEEVCHVFGTGICPPENTTEGLICRARAHTLADELNLVSGKLDPEALLAGADSGNVAFDHLRLGVYSTVEEALRTVEEILALPDPTDTELLSAVAVSKAIHRFYEDMNPQRPQCIFSEGEWAGVETKEEPLTLDDLIEEEAGEEEVVEQETEETVGPAADTGESDTPGDDGDDSDDSETGNADEETETETDVGEPLPEPDPEVSPEESSEAESEETAVTESEPEEPEGEEPVIEESDDGEEGDTEEVTADEAEAADPEPETDPPPAEEPEAEISE